MRSHRLMRVTVVVLREQASLSTQVRSSHLMMKPRVTELLPPLHGGTAEDYCLYSSISPSDMLSTQLSPPAPSCEGHRCHGRTARTTVAADPHSPQKP